MEPSQNPVVHFQIENLTLFQGITNSSAHELYQT